jgi:hypothetical protein
MTLSGGRQAPPWRSPPPSDAMTLKNVEVFEVKRIGTVVA